ncbi:hypothetical protein K450DRAFT_220585 [Umbelopsis ramanniana AG]|uniref:Voltage-gated hydrogen channel 1 n=1 Tax=Umbelopsis ramanniana AG TaxID=1314678 RepID=A0AAD5EIG9_UMBRA|nr:uncharacterized protein K450DRAFT_220585 [Umbelopsis ramanniana AG]KAI8583917.1 hypothetical protein K450DRAFT_220585 [Umbelopsis ramanniana AG]
MTSYGSIPAEPTDDNQQVGEETVQNTRAQWRVDLGEKLECSSIHWTILWLTIVDSLCVLLEIVITFFEECSREPVESILLYNSGLADHWAVVTAEWVSTGITCLFLVEVLLTMVAFGPSYYSPGSPHWIMHNLDAAVVITTFILEIILKGKEREVAGLLIVFRLWRIIKIMEAVAMGVSISETSSVDNVTAQLNKERQRRQELEQLLEQECAKREALEQENEKLKGNVV